MFRLDAAGTSFSHSLFCVSSPLWGFFFSKASQLSRTIECQSLQMNLSPTGLMSNVFTATSRQLLTFNQSREKKASLLL